MSDSRRYGSPREGNRSWRASALWGLGVMVVLLAFAVGVNLFIPGRAIHWDWVAAMGIGGAAALAFLRRRGLA